MVKGTTHNPYLPLPSAHITAISTHIICNLITPLRGHRETYIQTWEVCGTAHFLFKYTFYEKPLIAWNLHWINASYSVLLACLSIFCVCFMWVAVPPMVTEGYAWEEYNSYMLSHALLPNLKLCSFVYLMSYFILSLVL